MKWNFTYDSSKPHHPLVHGIMQVLSLALSLIFGIISVPLIFGILIVVMALAGIVVLVASAVTIPAVLIACAIGILYFIMGIVVYLVTLGHIDIITSASNEISCILKSS